MWKYMMASGHFDDPLTQSTYTDTELRRLDRMAGCAHDAGVFRLCKDGRAKIEARRERDEIASLIEEELVSLTMCYIDFARTHGIAECALIVNNVYMTALNRVVSDLYAIHVIHASTDDASDADTMARLVDRMGGLVQRCIAQLRHNASDCDDGTAEFLEFIPNGLPRCHGSRPSIRSASRKTYTRYSTRTSSPC